MTRERILIEFVYAKSPSQDELLIYANHKNRRRCGKLQEIVQRGLARLAPPVAR